METKCVFPHRSGGLSECSWHRHAALLRYQCKRLCARTVTDAFMRDIPCMVIRDCVADRTTAVLEANLFDLHQKYADVVPLSEALTYLGGLSAERIASPRDDRKFAGETHAGDHGSAAALLPRFPPIPQELGDDEDFQNVCVRRGVDGLCRQRFGFGRRAGLPVAGDHSDRAARAEARTTTSSRASSQTT